MMDGIYLVMLDEGDSAGWGVGGEVTAVAWALRLEDAQLWVQLTVEENLLEYDDPEDPYDAGDWLWREVEENGAHWWVYELADGRPGNGFYYVGWLGEDVYQKLSI